MSDLTENEILDRLKQALGEARRECLWLATQENSDNLSPRGGHYMALKKAITLAEGSARQMCQFREDARWLKLGILCGKAVHSTQHHYMAMRWSAFGTLAIVFGRCFNAIQDLNAKTGARGAILPARPSEFLIMPEWRAPERPRAPSLRWVN